MGFLAAQLFSYVQGAAIYREIHSRAVDLLPPGNGRIWFDVGCGPGLVARLAAARGYRTIGWDVNDAMIRKARRLAREEASSAQFSTVDLDALTRTASNADVVSAASLLAVLDDPVEGIEKLLSCVKRNGVLVVVEITPCMTPAAAWSALKRVGFGDRNWILLLWAWMRRNGRRVDPLKLDIRGIRGTRTELFGGLVAAWTLSRTDK